MFDDFTVDQAEQGAETSESDAEDYNNKRYYRVPALQLLSKDINRVNEKVADNGCKGRLRTAMAVQLVLTLYYNLMWILMMGSFNAYYFIDPLDGTNTSLIVGNNTRDSVRQVSLDWVKTDVSSFQCEGRIYYLNGTGPYANSTGGMIIPTTTDTTSMIVEVAQFVPLTFTFTLIFIFTRLYIGKFNQLKGFVKFKEETDDSATSFQHYVTPVRFALAFGVLTNVSKFGSLGFTDLCDEVAIVSSTFGNDDSGPYVKIFLYIGCWLFMTCWLMLWTTTCGCCASGETSISRLRFALGLISCILTFLWLEGLSNFDLQFNIEVPELFAVNLVSVVDFLVILGLDLASFCPTSSRVADEMPQEPDIECKDKARSNDIETANQGNRENDMSA